MADEKTTGDSEEQTTGGMSRSMIQMIIAGVVIVMLLSLFFHGRSNQSKLEKEIVNQQDTIQLLGAELTRLRAEVQATKDAAAATAKLAQQNADARKRMQSQQKKKSTSRVPSGKPVKRK